MKLMTIGRIAQELPVLAISSAQDSAALLVTAWPCQLVMTACPAGATVYLN